jgi:hypothetical protein
VAEGPRARGREQGGARADRQIVRALAVDVGDRIILASANVLISEGSTDLVS